NRSSPSHSRSRSGCTSWATGGSCSKARPRRCPPTTPCDASGWRCSEDKRRAYVALALAVIRGALQQPQRELQEEPIALRTVLDRGFDLPLESDAPVCVAIAHAGSDPEGPTTVAARYAAAVAFVVGRLSVCVAAGSHPPLRRRRKARRIVHAEFLPRAVIGPVILVVEQINEAAVDLDLGL